MKKIILLLISLFVVLDMAAQVPQAFNYQAIAKRHNGSPIVNQNISVRITISEGENGSILYQETHQTRTGLIGLFTVKVGRGNAGAGSFGDIPWQTGNKYMEVAIDPRGQNNFNYMGSVELLSVPFALYGEDADADPENELQELILEDNLLSLTDGNTIQLPDYGEELDGDPENEIQFLELEDNELTITGGNTILLPEDADADPANEIQDITLEGTELTIDQGSTVDLATAFDFTDTDDQNLFLEGTELSIEDGNMVDLGMLDTDTDNQELMLAGTELSIEGGNTVDLSGIDTDTDDQILKLDGTLLGIEDGNSVDLSPVNTDDQELTFDGQNLAIEDGNIVDLSPLNTDDQQLKYDEENMVLLLEDGGKSDLSNLKEIDDGAVTTPKLAVDAVSTPNIRDMAVTPKKLSPDVDVDPTNELQALTISNDTIYLSQGGFVVLPASLFTAGKYFYADRDGDGYGDKFSPVYVPEGVTEPEHFLIDMTDCDDSNSGINPDADEICDEVDNNCNGEIDEDCIPLACSGSEDCPPGYYCEAGACVPLTVLGDPCSASEECLSGSCENGVCVESGDLDGDGYTIAGGDCDDTNADINPGATEIEDGIDNNCDGNIDEGFDGTLPASFDWRSSIPGAISPIRDQGSCGSCYVFSAVGMIEARANIQAYRAGDPMPQFDLSEQEILSCSGSYPWSFGCSGGNVGSALQYVQDNGVVDETCFPYEAADVACNPCTNGIRVLIDQNDWYLPNTGIEDFIEEMKAEIYNSGPVVIQLYASSDFTIYTGGIYKDPSDQPHSNTARLVVGWGSEGGVDYWIIKMDWGSNWGENGYVRIDMTSGNLDYDNGYRTSTGYQVIDPVQ